ISNSILYVEFGKLYQYFSPFLLSEEVETGNLLLLLDDLVDGRRGIDGSLWFCFFGHRTALLACNLLRESYRVKKNDVKQTYRVNPVVGTHTGLLIAATAASNSVMVRLAAFSTSWGNNFPSFLINVA